jgi:hypothetical protein
VDSLLNVTKGNWAILRNGELRGPLSVDLDALFPIRENNLYGNRNLCWTIKGYYIMGGPSDYDIIGILPDEPMKCMEMLTARVKQLESALKPFAEVPYMGNNAFNRATLSDDDFRMARQVLGENNG